MLRLLRRSQWRKKLLWNFMEEVYDKLSISKNLTIRRCFSRYIILERSTVRNLLLRQD